MYSWLLTATNNTANAVVALHIAIAVLAALDRLGMVHSVGASCEQQQRAISDDNVTDAIKFKNKQETLSFYAKRVIIF